ncbi:conserved protein of unknown function [Pararobbsia alpina]|uniref:hypothetical protein n=1 Tax=Pararobbsia alpina TaxID=621374 RepID=UPI0039A431D4
MPLTDEQKDAIREEEVVRAEAQKEIAKGKEPVTWFGKLNAFLESKVGFWLLASVFTGLVTTGYGYVQNYLNKEQVARQKEIDDARRDTDVVIKIAPMLSSTDISQVRIGSLLLSGLAEHKAMDPTLETQVSVLFNETLLAGQKPDATPIEIARTNAMSQIIDNTPPANPASGANTGSTVPAAAVSPTPTVLDNSELPVRLYIQIAFETQRTTASADSTLLRQSRLIVPGIELVGPKPSPPQSELRYCKDKVSDPALEQVKTAIGGLPVPVTQLHPLNQSLCKNVRYNHFELWYGKG